MGIKRALMIVVMACGLSVAFLPLSGCADKTLYRMAAESGWNRWEEDHRPVLDDAVYQALPDTEEARAPYLPRSVYDARLFEKEQALRLLKD